ncbi:sialidase-3-like [Candoia aspera]|uniref:sialidase-3-like n=1 Tax=Candoia aspera TaxID=51853 RepID=UPI002FD80F9A
MAATPVGSGKVTLFRQEGGVTYRIPALLYLPSESTFLAFAEERSSPRDEHAKFLVMRRGQKEGTSVKWGPQEPLGTAGLPDHRTMNPCPVYDKKSGIVFLFFICVKANISEWNQLRTGRNAARLGYISSQDGGRTWSPTTDLTEQVIGDGMRNWATFAVGPGHGVQLSSGRLVIPAYAYYIHKSLFGLFTWSVKPHCLSFYSDDGGQTWARSQLLKGLKTSECQMAEVTCQDNRRVLYCNARSLHKFRAEAHSMDDGQHFANHSLCKELCELPYGCQGSVVSFFPMREPLDQGQKRDPKGLAPQVGASPSSASSEHPKSWLMYSHPTSGKKRVDLGIYLNTSPMEEGHWKSPWVLNKGPSGYSDLAVCEEGESRVFACVFECGVSRECEEIAFHLFTLDELLRNVRDSCCAATPPSTK